MNFIYYVDGEKFTTDNWDEIPWKEISSLDKNTPAFEHLLTGDKFWCLKYYLCHRLTGPALIDFDGTKYFYLNGKRYENIREWLKYHQNQDNAFQVEMLLKYG
jgi:hypothetical protein